MNTVKAPDPTFKRMSTECGEPNLSVDAPHSLLLATFLLLTTHLIPCVAANPHLSLPTQAGCLTCTPRTPWQHAALPASTSSQRAGHAPAPTQEVKTQRTQRPSSMCILVVVVAAADKQVHHLAGRQQSMYGPRLVLV